MARIVGRFVRVEPRRTARAFVLGLSAGPVEDRRYMHIGVGVHADRHHNLVVHAHPL